MSQPTDPTPQPHPTVSPAEAIPQVDPELAALHSQMLQLQAVGKNGANWFYWAAGLSLINSVMAVAGGNRRFLFGLGITQVADAEVGGIAAFIFALFVTGVVVLFGWFANKRLTPLFALGMFLYLLDALLLVFYQQWIGVAFHAFVLFQMFQGLSAYRQLSGILRTEPAAS